MLSGIQRAIKGSQQGALYQSVCSEDIVKWPSVTWWPSSKVQTIGQLGAWTSGFEFCSAYLLCLWLWQSHLTALILHFLLNKLKIFRTIVFFMKIIIILWDRRQPNWHKLTQAVRSVELWDQQSSQQLPDKRLTYLGPGLQAPWLRMLLKLLHQTPSSCCMCDMCVLVIMPLHINTVYCPCDENTNLEEKYLVLQLKLLVYISMVVNFYKMKDHFSLELCDVVLNNSSHLYLPGFYILFLWGFSRVFTVVNDRTILSSPQKVLYPRLI